MTIGIIAVLLVLFLTGLVVPQKGLFDSPQQFEQWNADHPVPAFVINALRLNEIYVAPVTVFFLALFFLNLVAVLVHRIPRVLRRAYLIDRQAAVDGIEKVEEDPRSLSLVLEGTQPDGGKALAGRAAAFFRKRLWSVMTTDDGRSFLAVRNRFSPLGFLLFHLSFFLCLAGGLLVVYTRFSGTLLLTEGEEFYADIGRFKVIDTPKIFPALPDLGITLLSVAPRYEGGTSTDLDVSVRVRYFSETFETVTGVNEPVRRGAISVLPQTIGVSPLFLLTKRGGAAVTGGFFSLNVLKGKEDSFQFPDHPYTVAVLFYPDFVEVDGKPSSRSQEIRDPVFQVRVLEGEQMVYDGLLRPGERAPLGPYDLSLGELRYWAEFLVVREYGTFPLAAGFSLGAAGLVLRLLFPQKTVRGHIRADGRGCTLYLNGSGEFYPHAFREHLARLAAELGGVLGGTKQEGREA